jgi:hypothetical protein
MADSSTKECPFCKEQVHADAVKCKWCGSALGSPGPTHGGTCPYCKEEIKPDAIRCRYCGSAVGMAPAAAAGGGCGCGGTAQIPSALFAAPGSVGRGQAAAPFSRPVSRISTIPAPGRPPIVVIGGPLDPSDPWYCEGDYVCYDFFGHIVCFWVCVEV